MTHVRSRQPGIIGTGRVAQALALALAPHSPSRPMLWGRSPEKLHVTAEQVGAIAIPDIASLVTECDIIAIAVADDALPDIVPDIAAVLPMGRTPLIFHVSGGSGAAILDPLRAAGALTAAIHPAMTFTGDPAVEARRMVAARFAITGSSAEATGAAKRIVALLGGVAVEIAEDRRALYHAALCHASNHLVTLIAGASRALEEAGVDDPAALLAPLVRAALENSLTLGFAGLSGPLLRGDARTIGGHLDTLETHGPEMLPAYRAMARATLDELKRGGTIPSVGLAALDSLLAVP